MENNNNKYYIIHNKNIAIAISNLIDEHFFTFDDMRKEGKKVYSFRNTPLFRQALKEYTELLNKFKNM